MASAPAPGGTTVRRHLLTWTVTGFSGVLLVCTAAGVVGTTALVALPTALFLCVYVAALAAGVRLLTGPVRWAAAAALSAAALLATAGWAAGAAVAVAGCAALTPAYAGPTGRTASRPDGADGQEVEAEGGKNGRDGEFVPGAVPEPADTGA